MNPHATDSTPQVEVPVTETAMTPEAVKAKTIVKIPGRLLRKLRRKAQRKMLKDMRRQLAREAAKEAAKQLEVTKQVLDEQVVDKFLEENSGLMDDLRGNNED